MAEEARGWYSPLLRTAGGNIDGYYVSGSLEPGVSDHKSSGTRHLCNGVSRPAAPA